MGPATGRDRLVGRGTSTLPRGYGGAVTRRRWLLSAGVAAALAAVVAAVVVVRGGRGERLAGAEAIGGGGDLSVLPLHLPSGDFEGVELTDLDLSSVHHLTSDGDDGLWLLGEYQVLLHVVDDRVELARPVDEPGGKQLTANHGGYTAVTQHRQVLVQGTGPAEGEDRVVEPELPEDTYLDSAAVDTGGTVYVGYRDDDGGRIDAYPTDGRVHTVVDGLPGTVRGLTVLDNHQLAFADGGGERERLNVVDWSGTVETVYEDTDPDRVITQVAETSRERLVTLSTGYGAWPRIEVTDLGSGTPDELATLSEVEPCEEPNRCGSESPQGVRYPVSVAAVGRDLVLLADNRVWRLADALA